MRGHSSNKQPTLPGSTLSSIDGRSVPLGMVAIPLLHAISGALGSWDEILLAVLVVGLVIVLVASLLVFGNRGGPSPDDE